MKNEPITAIYCRVACKDDDAMLHQESMLRQYANEHGYGNIKVYADNGYVGLNYDRPAYIRLQKDIDAGIVGAVIVTNTSRITRNLLDLPEWVYKHNREKTEMQFIAVMDDTTMLDSVTKDFRDALIQLYKRDRAIKRKKAIELKKAQ